MRLPNIVDQIKSNISGGISTEESRFDDLLIEDKIHSARATVIANYISTGKFPNAAWCQEVDIDAIDRDVEKGVVFFECPSVISVNSLGDGFVYVGNTNGITPFVRIGSGRMNLSMHNGIGKMNTIMWKYEFGLQNNAQVLCYNNPKLELIKIQAVFNDPTAVPNFRKDTDEYPVDRTVARDIVEMVSLDIMSKMRIPTDNIADGTDKIVNK